MASQEPGEDPDIHPNDGMSSKAIEIENKKPELSISNDCLTHMCDAEAFSDNDHIVVSTAEDIVTKVLHVDDDTTLNPWTFRMFFLGM